MLVLTMLWKSAQDCERLYNRRNCLPVSRHCEPLFFGVL